MGKTSTAVRAALYFRMSTEKQTDSIERQRGAVVPHVEREGYTVVGEYKDEGIPGDVFSGRPGFQRLLADAARRKFDVIVVDEVSRLSRAGVVDFIAKIIHPLREAGIRLEAVAQGRLEWDAVVPLILMVVDQSKISAYSPEMARTATLGMMRKALAGKHLGHAAPYGYSLAAHVVFGKVFVPDGVKADVVRFMFKHIDEGGTIGTLVAALYQRGVATVRSGDLWPRETLLGLLKKPCYYGAHTYGRSGSGKFCRTSGGEVRKVTRDDIRYQTKAAGDSVLIEGHHEALVSRDLFDRVGRKLRGNRGRKTPHVGGGDFLLSGLLICGNCGGGMTGKTTHGRLVYTCSTAARYGPGKCSSNTVRESVVLDTAIGVLRSHFLNPERLAAFREEVRRQEQEERSPSAVGGLRKCVAALSAKVDRGVSNALLADPTVVPMMTAAIAVLRKELAAASSELQRVEQTSPVDDLEGEIKRVEGYLFRLEEATGSGERGQLRQLLREVIAKIELHFAVKQCGTLRRSRLERGVVYIKGEDQVVEMSAADCPRKHQGDLSVPFTFSPDRENGPRGAPGSDSGPTAA